jgi:tetratricopeptide (TPR) repeat protein
MGLNISIGRSFGVQMKKIVSIVVLNLLIFGCASATPILRTDDVYDPQKCVYFNNTVSLKISFPKDKWKIYTNLDKTPTQMFGNLKQTEKESGGEIAMVGYHNSKTMFVMITMEGISDLSPMEYLKLIKETNKKDYSKLIENFTRERKIDDQDCAELEGIWEFEGINVTIRELFFIRNNFGCRFRFWAPTVIFESRKVEIENLLNNISFAKKGQYDKTISDFNKAIVINPMDAKAYKNRGSVFYREDHKDKAISDYTKAIEINPRYDEAYIARGNIYGDKGLYHTACRDFKRACELGSCETFEQAKRGGLCK